MVETEIFKVYLSQFLNNKNAGLLSRYEFMKFINTITVLYHKENAHLLLKTIILKTYESLLIQKAGTMIHRIAQKLFSRTR